MKTTLTKRITRFLPVRLLRVAIKLYVRVVKRPMTEEDRVQAQAW